MINPDHFEDNFETCLLQLHEKQQSVYFVCNSRKEAQSLMMRFRSYFTALKTRWQKLESSAKTEVKVLDSARLLSDYAGTTRINIEEVGTKWKLTLVHRALQEAALFARSNVDPKLLEVVRKDRMARGVRVNPASIVIPKSDVYRIDMEAEIETLIADGATKESLKPYFKDNRFTVDPGGGMGMPVSAIARKLWKEKGTL